MPWLYIVTALHSNSTSQCSLRACLRLFAKQKKMVRCEDMHKTKACSPERAKPPSLPTDSDNGTALMLTTLAPSGTASVSLLISAPFCSATSDALTAAQNMQTMKAIPNKRIDRAMLPHENVAQVQRLDSNDRRDKCLLPLQPAAYKVEPNCVVRCGKAPSPDNLQSQKLDQRAA